MSGVERNGKDHMTLDCGARIEREPKGIPDAVLFAGPERIEVLYDSAMILSVQGYTSRIVCIYDMDSFLSQNDAFRDRIFPESIPIRIGLPNSIDEAKSFRAFGQVAERDTDKKQLAKITRRLILEKSGNLL